MDDLEALLLPTLLSHLYVCFVVELDNEFERRVPHWREGFPRTAAARALPRLVSLAIWSTCLRHVPDDGITLADLERVARTDTNLDGVRRWGYVTIAGRARRGPAATTRRTDLIVPTEVGKLARDTWATLVPEIEERWGGRYGSDTTGALIDALRSVDTSMGATLPDSLPILGYGLWCAAGVRPGEGDAPRSLYGLMSRVLLAFALEAERHTTVSLPIGANVLRRLANNDAVPVAELLRRAGVSREAIDIAIRYLEKQKLMTIGTEAGGRLKMARLTESGLDALGAHERAVDVTEAGWREQLGDRPVDRLRDALLAIARGADGTQSHLLAAMRPSPGEWRASLPPPQVLPDFPMVLHRGGWPDGS